MHRDQEATKRVVSEIKETLRKSHCVEEPSVSELSFKPDFMINIDNRLTFVEIAYLKKKENVDWKTLRLIEQIFETKLFFGNDSVFTLIVLGHVPWKKYCLELLDGFFDKVIYRSEIERVSNVYAEPNQGNFELWNLERQFQRSRSRSISMLDLDQFHYEPLSTRRLEENCHRRLMDLDLRPSRNYPIRNLKNYYLRREMNLRFYFDFFVNRKVVEVKSFRRISGPAIQNLMIKSRLIRYRKIDDRIEQVSPAHKMILLINGSITGPEYDRMRYLRMLTASGWDVYPIGILRNRRKAREVFS